MRFWFGCVLILSHLLSPAVAFGQKGNLEAFYNVGNAPTGQSQYAFKPVDERNLIPVRVMGQVGKPGVHYVPRNADLLDVIGLAGGTTAQAEIEDISIRTRRAGKDEVLQIDGEKLFGTSKNMISAPGLFPNDVVYIPVKQPLVSDDTARIVTILGALASMVLSVVIVRRELKD